MVANDGLLQRVVLTTEISEALRRMGKVGLLRHLQNLQRKRPRQSVALQKSRRTGFHALEGRALSRPQRVLQVPLLINFNKPTLIVNRRSETFFFESLCLGLPRRLVRRSVFAKVEAVSAKAGALCGKIHKIIRRTKIFERICFVCWQRPLMSDPYSPQKHAIICLSPALDGFKIH